MFESLRLTLGMTISDVAKATNRSPNYIFKAESLTFPNAPPALLDFYKAKTKIPINLLKSQYRSAQRSQRRAFLEHYIPAPPAPPSLSGFSNPNGLSQITFRRLWVLRNATLPTFSNGVNYFRNPTEYALSQGLCIPASAVYRAEKDGYINQSILNALSDLVEYCQSGEYISDYGYMDNDSDPYDVYRSLCIIQEELHRRVGRQYGSKAKSKAI